MDKRELNTKLTDFKKACSDRHFPINGFTLKPAYPGDDSSSYFIEVKKTPWIANTSMFDAIERLTHILYDTTDEATRRSIFAIRLLDYYYR